MTDAPGQACAVAHGDAPSDGPVRTLVAVFAGPVARHLLHFAHDVGFHTARWGRPGGFTW